MKRIAWIWMLTFALVYLVGCSEGATPAGGDGDIEGGEGESEEKRIPVRVQKLELERVVQSISVDGKIESERDVTLLAETAGRVVRVPAVLGARVKKGAELIVLDGEPYRIARDAAEAQLAQARAAEEQATLEFERAKGLFDSQNLSQQLYDKARFAMAQAKAAAKSAEANCARARRDLRLSTVRAPFAGEVAAVHVKQGDMVGPSVPVAQLVDRDDLKVVAGVSEDAIGAVKPGFKARVLIPTLREEPFDAKVVSLGPKALKPTMTYPVELKFDEKSDLLRVGMVARVAIEVDAGKDGIVVPLEIPVERFDRFYLFVLEGDHVVERRVLFGETRGRNVVIESGVKGGESIVITGQQNLKDGSLVTVVE